MVVCLIKLRLYEKMIGIADFFWTCVIIGSVLVVALKLRSELKIGV